LVPKNPGASAPGLPLGSSVEVDVIFKLKA